MGRPKINPAKLRGNVLQVRLNNAERAAVTKRAKIGGQTPSAWVREAICSAAGIPAARSTAKAKGKRLPGFIEESK